MQTSGLTQCNNLFPSGHVNLDKQFQRSFLLPVSSMLHSGNLPIIYLLHFFQATTQERICLLQ